MGRTGLWTAALAALALAVGCAHTAPTRFYLLKATAEKPTPGPAADGPSVVIEPVQVAAYLDRRQIVSRLGDGEVHVAEFHQWAEPLADGVRRVLVEDLSRRLSSQRVWAGDPVVAQSGGLRVRLMLLRFDRAPGEPLVLTAHWSVAAGAGGKLVAERLSTLRVPVAGTEVGAQVEAQSRALTMLSEQIAAVASGQH